jgi:hypothetical protein
MQTSGTPRAHRRRHRALGDLHEVVRDAEPTIKAAIYEQLGLKVTYLPGQDKSGPT